ncbi:Mitochondrial processing peptidase [Rhizoctonia solani]|uniref:Mitochondrial processing peptidase n=1 Tax=Rhizoctonia solani TaxID=456999 RepID=A0A8H7IC09_9AGAM|nr:Mitochondrial processing peptidase [Rhizoctonia solani]
MGFVRSVTATLEVLTSLNAYVCGSLPSPNYYAANKVRVATESTPGHFGALGVYVDAGSRYESPRMSGCSHILDRMAWKSTHTETADSVSEQIDALGGQFLCSSSRETIMYQASHFTHDAPAALSIISDTIQNSLFLPEELDAQRDAAAYEVREVNAKPEMILPEIIHTARAYGRCGAGIPHEELVELAQKHFGDISVPAAGPQKVPTHLLNSSKSQQQPSFYKSLTTAATSFLHNPSEPSFSNLAHARANYTGGHVFIHAQISTSPTSGGPGKGMYSSYTPISSITTLKSTIHNAISSPSRDRAPVLYALYKNVPAAELQRAKNQLKSSLVMALESRAVEVEDLGRQVLVHGRKIGVDEMCDKIDNVGPADMRRVAGRVFGESGSRASVIVMGAEDVKDPVGVLKSYGVGKS